MIAMKVCSKNFFRPAHFLAFISGFCPYRRFTDHSYGRSALGTIFQLANVILMASAQAYEAGFYLPAEYSSLTDRSVMIIQSINIFLSLWLSVDRFVLASRTLRCLRVAEDLVETIHQISSSRHQPIAFHFAIVWSMVFLSRVLRPEGFDFMEVTLFVTQFLTLFCETLVMEFITVICVALETINQSLNNWQTSGTCDNITTLNKLQSLYLKAAHLAEVVNDAFGIGWMVSFIAKSMQIISLFYWILKLLSAAIDPSDDKVSTVDHIKYAYLIFRLVSAMLRCFQICYYFDQPSAKRVKMVGLLCELITRNGDGEISNKMNEFNLQVSLRKMRFTGGGFFVINLHFFVETVGTWFTLLVILIQMA